MLYSGIAYLRSYGLVCCVWALLMLSFAVRTHETTFCIETPHLVAYRGVAWRDVTWRGGVCLRVCVCVGVCLIVCMCLFDLKVCALFFREAK